MFTMICYRFLCFNDYYGKLQFHMLHTISDVFVVLFNVNEFGLCGREKVDIKNILYQLVLKKHFLNFA